MPPSDWTSLAPPPSSSTHPHGCRVLTEVCSCGSGHPWTTCFSVPGPQVRLLPSPFPRLPAARAGRAQHSLPRSAGAAPVLAQGTTTASTARQGLTHRKEPRRSCSWSQYLPHAEEAGKFGRGWLGRVRSRGAHALDGGQTGGGLWTAPSGAGALVSAAAPARGGPGRGAVAGVGQGEPWARARSPVASQKEHAVPAQACGLGKSAGRPVP